MVDRSTCAARDNALRVVPLCVIASERRLRNRSARSRLSIRNHHADKNHQNEFSEANLQNVHTNLGAIDK